MGVAVNDPFTRDFSNFASTFSVFFHNMHNLWPFDYCVGVVLAIDKEINGNNFHESIKSENHHNCFFSNRNGANCFWRKYDTAIEGKRQ